MDTEISTRDAKLEDLNFVYATILRGLYYGNTFYGKINKDAFFNSYDQVIKSLLMKPGTKLTIACLQDSPDVLLGYSISSPEAIHYVFVKEAWRRRGIASTLLGPIRAFKQVTHITDATEELRNKYRMGFNPFLI